MDEYYKTRIGKKILLHAGRDAANKAFAFFDDDAIVLSDPTGNISIHIAKDFGIGIQGPLSLPSTLYTPVPWLRRSIPKSSQELVNGLSDILALI